MGTVKLQLPGRGHCCQVWPRLVVSLVWSQGPEEERPACPKGVIKSASSVLTTLKCVYRKYRFAD